MTFLWKDVRYAARSLSANPGFTAIAVVTLALGIGANAAIFSVVDAVFLRPLPYRDPARLTLILATNTTRGIPMMGTSPPDYREWKQGSRAFESMAAFYGGSFNLASPDGDPERFSGLTVTSDFFPILGIRAVKGRTFLPGEERYGDHHVAVVSDGLWRRRFGADPSVVGRTVSLNNEPFTIVGILPGDYRDPATGISGAWGRSNIDVWVPMAFEKDSNWNTRNNYFLMVLGRMKSGIGIEQARSDLSEIASRIEREVSESKGIGTTVLPLRTAILGDTSRALLVLWGSVSFVLLIACANVANLLLARSSTRHREIAIRTALGATRGRIVRLLLTESLLLGLVGGTLGLLLAFWGADSLVAIGPPMLGQFHDVAVSGRALAFLAGLSILTPVLFGLAPALLGARSGLGEGLKDHGDRGGSRGAGGPMRSAIVVCEIAISLVLLVGAGLLIRSFIGLLHVDPGFSPDHLVTAHIALPRAKYKDATEAAAFFEQLLRRVENLPGVRAAGVTTCLPLSGQGQWGKQLTIQERPAPSLDRVPAVEYRLVSEDYFKTMNMHLRSGRAFSSADRADSLPVAIVNETLARRLFPCEDPLGRRISMNPPERLIPLESRPPNFRIVWLTIVGVLADVKHVRLDEPPPPEVYAPFVQNLEEPVPMMLAVRTESNPAAMGASIRAAVRAIDPLQPVARVATMEEVLDGVVAQPRFNTLLLTLFAGISLLLAAVGVYGVTAFSVARRTHEIGIRMAIGARRGQVISMVLRQELRLVVAGVAAGLAASLALTRFIAGMLYGTAPNDPLTLAAVALVLITVSAAACWIPARRATRIEPMAALRYE